MNSVTGVELKESGGQQTTLNQLYQGDFPGRDESFWDEVRPRDFDTLLTIHTMPKHKIEIMLLGQYRIEHLDELTDRMDDDQKEVLERYMNDPALSSKVIVISGHQIIDGNHRALAAAYRGVPINYIDLTELDEPEEIDETGKIPGNQRAKEWINKVYELYPGTWQNNHMMTWGEGEDQHFCMFELVPSFSKKDAVEVKWFQAYPLRGGVGSRGMQELQRLAREDGISLTLFPWDKGQVSQAALTRFYKKQGYKPISKGGRSMYWTPELDEAAPQTEKEMTQCSAQDLQKLLGKGKMNAMIRHPWFQEYRNYEHAYKHGVTRVGFAKVEVYPFFREVHTTADGRIRPLIMLQFTFSYGGTKVIQVEKYFRDKEPDENEKRLGPAAGWKHMKSWATEENAVEKAWAKHNVTEDTESSIPEILYHASYRPLLRSIKLNGLGGKGSEAKKWEDSKPGVVYLATSQEVAESYAEASDAVTNEWLDEIVVLKIKTGKLDPSRFSIDHNVLDNEGDTLEYYGIIPSSEITV